MKKITLLLATVAITLSSVAQVDKKQFKKDFAAAFDSLYAERYNKALDIFLKLDAQDPNNANIMANIGYCYISSQRVQDKIKAIPYLEKVVVDENLNPYYVAQDIKEKKAPLESIWWLGKAYHANEQFEEALARYQEYKEFLNTSNTDGQQVEKIVNRDIAYTRNAMELKKNPVNVRIEELATSPSSNVNTEFPDYRPIVNADETIMYFTSRRYGSTGNLKDDDDMYYEDIYYTVKKDGLWRDAMPIGESVNTNEHEATISLSPDGKKMYIYKFNNATSGDIYYIEYDGEEWSQPKDLLRGKINTDAWETHATISMNEDLIIFTSDRDLKGNYVGRDLWYIEKNASGEWGEVKNMGAPINTEFDEESPYLHPDGKTLYFSSRGHNSMGDFDVFVTEKQDDGTWSQPRNLGYPVNTVGSDVFFQPSLDGKRAYFASFRDGGKGEHDIYIIELDEPERDIAILKGCAGNANQDNLNNTDGFGVSVSMNGNKVGDYTLDKNTGLYSVIMQTGKEYTFTYSLAGATKEWKYTAPSGKGYIELNKTAILKDGEIELADATTSLENACYIAPVVIIDTPFTKSDTLIIRNLNFVFDKTVLIDKSIPDVELVINYMNRYTDVRIKIDGHTDSKGSDSYNMRLGRRRAEEIKKLMVSRGIDPKRLETATYGESRPVAPNEHPDGSDNPEGRQENRRIEFIVIRDKK
jgi:outer membrane protein OmpA-like peptidoglycan-associated protein/tetratricopeptide (TPR) repeat protein